jgi:prepilin-type N-terminal cleavage/methylation domain-containing protein
VNRAAADRPGADAGFTFMEILVAMMLMAALTVVVTSGFLSGEGLIHRTIRAATEASQLLRTRETLRRAAARVRIPWWSGPVDAQEQNGELAIPWVDGNPASALRLAHQGAMLVVSLGADGPVSALGPFVDSPIALARDDQGRPWGLRVDVRSGSADRAAVEIVVAFGSAPLGAGGP